MVVSRSLSFHGSQTGMRPSASVRLIAGNVSTGARRASSPASIVGCLVHGEDRHVVRDSIVEAELGLGDAHGVGEGATARHHDDGCSRRSHDGHDRGKAPAFGHAPAELDDRRSWRCLSA